MYPCDSSLMWWQVSANTTSRAGLRPSQPSDVLKLEVKPWEDPPHVLGLPWKVTWEGLGSLRLQAEDPTVD